MRTILGLVSIVACLTIYSCQKELTEKPLKEVPGIANPSSSNSSRLSYGDSVFYLKNQPGNYLILPVSIPAGQGYFSANPWGLVIDSTTGRINVTQSETGLRYKVYFFNTAGQVQDSTKIVISGIDYIDSIYRIQATNVYDTAFPLYNAKTNPPLPCSDDDDDDDGDGDDDDGCIFDETDLDDDGNDDIPGVIQEKLLVDTKKGTIDVEASYHAGVFGSNPVNGATKDFTFYYRINDASNRALNKITVRLYHFNTVNDIPQWLLDELNKRKNISTQVNSRPSNTSRTESYEFGPKRPPIIVIVSS